HGQHGGRTARGLGGVDGKDEQQRRERHADLIMQEAVHGESGKQDGADDTAVATTVAIRTAASGIICGSIQPTNETAETMEAERINAISALLNDLTGREAELRRYL